MNTVPLTWVPPRRGRDGREGVCGGRAEPLPPCDPYGSPTGIASNAPLWSGRPQFASTQGPSAAASPDRPQARRQCACASDDLGPSISAGRPINGPLCVAIAVRGWRCVSALAGAASGARPSKGASRLWGTQSVPSGVASQDRVWIELDVAARTVKPRARRRIVKLEQIAGFCFLLGAATSALAGVQALPDGDQWGSLASFDWGPQWVDLNWAESPFKPTIQELVGYNDNVLGAPKGFATPAGVSRGDFSSLTLLGGSSTFYWSGQQFFVNGDYGFTRYAHDASFDSNQYLINGGANWTLTSRCSGKLIASQSMQPSLLEEQVGGGLDDATNQSLNETAKCLLGAEFSLLFNSGVAENTSSTAPNKLNDNRSNFLAAGLGYQASTLDDFQLLYMLTRRDYTDRSGSGISGLVSGVEEKDLTLNYHRKLGPDLDFTGAIGGTNIDLLSPGAPSNALPLEPHYSVSLNWQATPKLAFTGTAARSEGMPTSLASNVQVSDSISFGAKYAFSPKLSFQASATDSRSNSGQTFLAGSTYSASQQAFR